MSRRAEATPAEVERLMTVVGDVIRLHGPAYLPVYQRLERERDRLTDRQAALERAMALSAAPVAGGRS